ncbi:TPA: ArpU family transcriptional regulator [Streptococcus suis]|nr:ArpU family transcriptional regulator [Streptococcus suis]HEM6419313.1 ArpU family transcriptional regulator [Streptococcus suis]HEM6425512.1 ArpU family transcriptional regulator [Streptococcus suis]
MTFFPEIDIEKTKANAKRKLKEYPRWRRVANDVDGQKVTATYTFEPRQAHGDPSRPVERLAINRVDAEAELEAIEYAVSHLFDPMHRKLLHERYLIPYPKSHFELREEIGYEKSQYYDMISSALLAFAELYRGSILVAIFSEK